MAKQSFKERLARGEKIEYAILGIIKKKYPKAYKVTGYYPDYDLYIPEKKMGVEVKYDSKSLDTGNYIIDIERNDKPSGLAVTKANLWVIWDNKDLLYISPAGIKECIKDNNIKPKKIYNSSSEDIKKVYLIPRDKLKKYDYISGLKKFINKVREYFPDEDWLLQEIKK